MPPRRRPPRGGDGHSTPRRGSRETGLRAHGDTALPRAGEEVDCNEVDGKEVNGNEVDGKEVHCNEVDGKEVHGNEVDGKEVVCIEVDGKEVV